MPALSRLWGPEGTGLVPPGPQELIPQHAHPTQPPKWAPNAPSPLHLIFLWSSACDFLDPDKLLSPGAGCAQASCMLSRVGGGRLAALHLLRRHHIPARRLLRLCLQLCAFLHPSSCLLSPCPGSTVICPPVASSYPAWLGRRDALCSLHPQGWQGDMEAETLYNLLQLPKEATPPADEELLQGACPCGTGVQVGRRGGSTPQEQSWLSGHGIASKL